MPFTILERMAKPGPDLFYEPAFRLIVETHLNILKVADATVALIPSELAYQYEGDFYGYLVEIGVPTEYHWIYLRVNGMENPNQFAKEVRDPLGRQYQLTLIKPNENLITGLVSFYLNRKF